MQEFKKPIETEELDIFRAMREKGLDDLSVDLGDGMQLQFVRISSNSIIDDNTLKEIRRTRELLLKAVKAEEKKKSKK